MDTAVHLDLHRGSRLREFANLRQPWFVGILFVVLLSTQALGFLVLGTGPTGCGLSESILVLDGLLAIACAWSAFRRARGTIALFWFLFAVVLVVLLIPTVVQTYDTLFDQSILSESTRNLLYALYGAPILMMLFLSETRRRTRVKSEIFLDFFQVAIVVGLIYSTFFFLPVQRMLPADAVLRDISLSDVQSLLLLAAVLVRLQFARVPGTRNLFLRLALFLIVCAVLTFVGGRIYLHYSSSATAWFDLGWAIPQVFAALIALTWAPSPEPESTPEPANFLSFLGTNLVLVAMLACINLLMDRWKQAHGEILTDVAIAASLLAFILRLALTQFHQQQEIALPPRRQLRKPGGGEAHGNLIARSHDHQPVIHFANQPLLISIPGIKSGRWIPPGWRARPRGPCRFQRGCRPPTSRAIYGRHTASAPAFF